MRAAWVKPSRAHKSLEELQTWQNANLPSDNRATGVEAAAFMLQYRIASLEADLTGPGREGKRMRRLSHPDGPARQAPDLQRHLRTASSQAG
jgi:hypothetical protein